ncbi:Hypothetical_protein [Hexamita inflata]|uniref:Hypothetical_protein n=1 Tax=Hexamita inflata TaxID=28002 RepID=A0AA86R3P8_9EUKA|nr:Hypothetical protein HINF_LOCUS52914 [Hexamita inflata]
MCKKNKYCCLLTWVCIFFLSLLVAGITLSCIPTEFEYPVYSERNGNLSHQYTYSMIYLNVGLGVTLSLVGLFGFIITICVSCILKKKTLNFEIEPLVRKEIPAVTFPQMNFQYQQPQVNQVVVPRMM